MVLSLCAPSFKQLAVNIAQAADCRDFVRHKQEEEVSRAAQKRKKEIAWGCVFVLPPLVLESSPRPGVAFTICSRVQHFGEPLKPPL